MPLVSRVGAPCRNPDGTRLTPLSVSEALVRYINQGTTLGSVNVPEVQMRSLTLDESDTARVSSPLCHLEV